MRNTKTPAERAQEKVDILERKLKRVVKTRSLHQVLVSDLMKEEADLEARLKYALENPDLRGAVNDA